MGSGFDILNVVLGKLKEGEDVLQEQDELVIGGLELGLSTILENAVYCRHLPENSIKEQGTKPCRSGNSCVVERGLTQNTGLQGLIIVHKPDELFSQSLEQIRGRSSPRAVQEPH